jgi:hypothetical protein
MRIAHVTNDEVKQALAIRAARPLGAIVAAIATEDTLPNEEVDAVLLDLDSVPWDGRQALLDQIRSETTTLPTAVYGYCLSEDQADSLRFHGVAVAQRVHVALIRTLANAVRRSLAAVPPDDATTDLTWVNMDA